MKNTKYKKNLKVVGKKAMTEIEPIARKAADDLTVIAKDFIDDVLNELFDTNKNKRRAKKNDK